MRMALPSATRREDNMDIGHGIEEETCREFELELAESELSGAPSSKSSSLWLSSPPGALAGRELVEVNPWYGLWRSE